MCPARLTGLAEAERQVAVAQRLYTAAGNVKPWAKLTLEARRPWIDQSCRPENLTPRPGK